MQELPLNGFYESTTPRNSNRRCVNLIPINEPNGSLSTNMLECPSGLVPNGPHDVSSVLQNTNYSAASSGVVTSQVATVNVSPTPNAIGSKGEAVLVPYSTFAIFYQGEATKPIKLDFPDGFDYARVAASQSDIVICSPGYAPDVAGSGSYCAVSYPGTVASEIDIPSEFPLSPEFHDVAFAGGRFVWASYDDVGGDRFRCYYSDIGDTMPRSSQFFSPDDSTSRITGVHNLNGSLWVFDADNAFLFTVTSSVSTPFQWQRSSTLPVGCAGPHAKAEVSGVLYVLGRYENGSYSVVGLGSGRVSSPAVDAAINSKIQELSSFDILRECRLFGYRDRGRDILAVSVGDVTYCYNVTDRRWFEMGDGDRWEVCGYGTAFGKDLFIGRTITVDEGVIKFNMSVPTSETGLEFDVVVPRFFESAHFNASNSPVRISEIEPVTAVGGESIVSVSVTKDYGATFGLEREKTISSGEPFSRTRFLNWGVARQAFGVRVGFRTQHQSKIVSLLSRISTGGRGT